MCVKHLLGALSTVQTSLGQDYDIHMCQGFIQSLEFPPTQQEVAPQDFVERCHNCLPIIPLA